MAAAAGTGELGCGWLWPRKGCGLSEKKDQLHERSNIPTKSCEKFSFTLPDSPTAAGLTDGSRPGLFGGHGSAGGRGPAGGSGSERDSGFPAEPVGGLFGFL